MKQFLSLARVRPGVHLRGAVALSAALWLAVASAEAPAMTMDRANAGTDKEPGVYVLDALVTVDAPPLAVRSVISRLCDYRESIPYLAYCRVYRAEGRSAWSYAMVDPPILMARDYVIQSIIESDLTPEGQGTYRTRWIMDDRYGPKPREGIIRLGLNEGSWQLDPVDGGKRTQLHYRARCTPGGIIPAWAAGYVAKNTLPEYMRTLERMAQDEERRKVVLAVHPNDPWHGVRVAPLDDPLPRASTAKVTPPGFPAVK